MKVHASRIQSKISYIIILIIILETQKYEIKCPSKKVIKSILIYLFSVMHYNYLKTSGGSCVQESFIEFIHPSNKYLLRSL